MQRATALPTLNMDDDQKLEQVFFVPKRCLKILILLWEAVFGEKKLEQWLNILSTSWKWKITHFEQRLSVLPPDWKKPCYHRHVQRNGRIAPKFRRSVRRNSVRRNSAHEEEENFWRKRMKTNFGADRDLNLLQYDRTKINGMRSEHCQDWR